MQMSETLFSLEQAATQLSVSPAILNRWHHMNWAAATDYEEVSVPRVGRISARRWRRSAVEDLRSRIEELHALDDELTKLRQLCRNYGKDHARALLEGYPDPKPPLAEKKLLNVAIDSSEMPICVKDTITAFLKQAHKWAIATLQKTLEINLTACKLDVSWHQVTVREFWSPFNFEASSGGIRDGKYHVQIRSGVRLEEVREFTRLFEDNFSRAEYDFIASDREIGDKIGLTAFQLVLRTYLHEIAHAAAAWLKVNRRSLPSEMLEFETKARFSSSANHEEPPKSGHSISWSAIYRLLVRRSTCKEQNTAR